MSNGKFARLSGKALLEKLKTLSHLPHRDRAKQCGYYTIVSINGGRQQLRVHFSEFYDAILKARAEEKQALTPENRHQPRAFDAVIGGQDSPPLNTMVLGGIEGVKSRLTSSAVEARIAALNDAVNYGHSGLDLLIAALNDSSGQVRNIAYQLLQERQTLKTKKALSDFDSLLLFTTFQDWKVEKFNPQIGITNAVGTAYLVKNMEQLESLLQDPQANHLQALLCQVGSEDFSCNQKFRYIVDALFDVHEQLPALKALCIGNSKERIGLGDISAILKAYPKLEVLQVRGGYNLYLNPLRHNNLKTLIIDTAVLNNETISSICGLELPALEYLDVGFDDYYSKEKSHLSVVIPILDGKLFPKLRYLGIRGGKDYNKLAAAIARSTLIQRLLVLDLSDGTLGDRGAQILLNCPAIHRLHTLNLSKNYSNPK